MIEGLRDRIYCVPALTKQTMTTRMAVEVIGCGDDTVQ
jgi:hypothetical protein